MRSVEIVFDAASDHAIRRQWAALNDAGVPSLALHTAPSNQPHVTLVAGADLEPVALRPEEAVLPDRLDLGGITLFPAGRGRWVLVRAVVVSTALARVHREMAERFPGGLPTTLPDAWSPHITLARRLTASGVAIALDALASAGALEHRSVGVASLRFWNGDERVVSELWRRESAAEDPLAER